MSQPRKLIHLPKVRMLRGRLSSGIRITNIKSIKPPDPEISKKQEEDKLRAQLEKEIVCRGRACSYKGYPCVLPVVRGRQYCARHILRDPTAPYRQCMHTSASGTRCQYAAPLRPDPSPGLCYEHARSAMLARQRSAAPPPPVTTTETLLHQLSHYVKTERPRTTSCASSVSVVSDPAEPEQGTPQAVDPFNIDAPSINSARTLSILECASDSGSDSDGVIVDGTPDVSDTEDAPCEREPLWRAGVFTAEEAVSEAKSTLRLLQTGYIQQMDRMKTLLEMARANYLKAFKAEKDQYCSIDSQSRGGPRTARELRQLRKLKAYASYHTKLGIDAILARKLQHKRSKGGVVNPGASRCTFAEGGVRCAGGALPAARHCRRHILRDRRQVLFTACGDARGVTTCREPVATLPAPAPRCRYHTDPPHYTVFTMQKDDSDTDSQSHTTSSSRTEDAAEQSDGKDMLVDNFTDSYG